MVMAMGCTYIDGNTNPAGASKVNYVINYTVCTCTYSTYLLARIRGIWVVIIGEKQNSLVAILVWAEENVSTKSLHIIIMQYSEPNVSSTMAGKTAAQHSPTLLQH